MRYRIASTVSLSLGKGALIMGNHQRTVGPVLFRLWVPTTQTKPTQTTRETMSMATTSNYLRWILG